MSAIHTDGGLASNVGRPLESIYMPPSYTVTFYNKTLDAPLTKTNIASQNPNINYDEKLNDDGIAESKINVKYSRVLHYTISDATTGRIISDLTYAPFIDSYIQSGENITFKTLPLVEVINPRFVEVSHGVFLMYFFSNFSTSDLPDNIYTSNPKYLRRIIEFSSDKIDEVYGNTNSESDPLPNNLNYADPDLGEDTTPRIAFLSTLVRMSSGETSGSGSSSASKSSRMLLIFEKPQILTWVGHRFGLDSNPPLIVNTTQKIEWASNKVDSDSLDQDAVDADPIRQVPYHHVIDGIESIMYPSYGGINFKTKPIHDVYDKALDHIFQVEGSYSKTFKFSGNNSLRSLGVIQQDIQSIGFDSFECTGIQGSASSTTSISDSGLSPARKHFAVFRINMDDPYAESSSSSSSSSTSDSYTVIIPASLDPRLADKPEFWSYYWEECENSSSSSSGSLGVGGEIEMSGLYGEGCINGITVWARLEAKHYAYINGVKDRLWLTIGLKTSFDVDLDLLWQGYFLSSEDVKDGDYKRYWGLGDDCPDTITVEAN